MSNWKLYGFILGFFFCSAISSSHIEAFALNVGLMGPLQTHFVRVFNMWQMLVIVHFFPLSTWSSPRTFQVAALLFFNFGHVCKYMIIPT
jgi:hypothetical protein